MLTFRDFAAAIMKGDVDGGGRVLEQLLALDAESARAASSYFHGQSAAQGPAFMGKAMGLRAAVASGALDGIRDLLRDCFALTEPSLSAAATALLKPA